MKKNKKIFSKNSNWQFRGSVIDNFDYHIDKSVPLYKETHNLYLYLSDFFLEEKTKIIDIGCSTGTFLQKLIMRHKKVSRFKNIKLIGIDNEKDMITKSKKKISYKNLKFINKSVFQTKLNNSCIISSFYTMQFIHVSKRQKLINKIFKSLNWGGAFFMVEKVRASDARFQDIMNQVYIDFKKDMKFSDKEIVNKSRSLKGVMEPFSSQGNIDLLKRAGFKDILTVFKYGFFEGFLAIK
tara:strand:+ start:3036 stop:3752 length:717 start_codon:yes stop_codon:yes gene_type:complete